ncbi:VanZ family protein [Neobacillus vireti]|uniref:VanZ family protein n=1 Tax=Neobacillus vireti TaxID=220686 RepID=UPI002FFF5A4E
MESGFKLLRQIYFLLVIIWGLFLGINTWSENLGNLLYHQSIVFKWDSSPDYLSFFNFYDISKIHQYFIVVKLGHFLGFLILDLLLFNWLKNHQKALVVSLIYALLTEVLQLYFGRDGRLYDLMIDSLGVAVVYFSSKGHLVKRNSTE